MKLSVIALALLPLALPLSSATAAKRAASPTIAEYVKMAESVDAGFTCSYWVRLAGWKHTYKYLMGKSLDMAREIVRGLRMGDITPHDLGLYKLSVLNLNIENPSDDFVLGQYYQTVSEGALRVTITSYKGDREETMERIAMNEYVLLRCEQR
jgi:hypothetical protein